MRGSRAIQGLIGFVAAWLAAAATAGADTRVRAPAVTVETTDELLLGRLAELSDGWVVLEGDTFARLPRERVLTIRFETKPYASKPATDHRFVTLNDGSQYGYRAADIRHDRVHFELVEGSTLDTPIEAIRSWRVAKSAEEAPDSLGPAADRLLVKNRSGDGVTPVEGIVLSVTNGGVRFALGNAESAEPVDAPWSRLAAIQFFRPDQRPKAVPAVITLRGGGRLHAEHIGLGEAGLVYGSALGARGVLAVGLLASIDLSMGRVHPADGLDVLEADWRPYFGGQSGRKGYALGRSLTGDPLRLRFPDWRLPSGWPGVATVRTFSSGIAVRSEGELRLDLPAAARQLKGVIGLDPAAARAGSAGVTVLANERILWSGVVAGDTRPVELNEALSGERTLTLRVEYGDNLDAGDRVHFADLRVIQ